MCFISPRHRQIIRASCIPTVTCHSTQSGFGLNTAITQSSQTDPYTPGDILDSPVVLKRVRKVKRQETRSHQSTPLLASFLHRLLWEMADSPCRAGFLPHRARTLDSSLVNKRCSIYPVGERRRNDARGLDGCHEDRSRPKTEHGEADDGFELCHGGIIDGRSRCKYEALKMSTIRCR